MNEPKTVSVESWQKLNLKVEALNRRLRESGTKELKQIVTALEGVHANLTQLEAALPEFSADVDEIFSGEASPGETYTDPLEELAGEDIEVGSVTAKH